MPSLVRNPISLAGAWLTTLSAFGFLTYYAAEWFGLFGSPYSGLIGFVLIPAGFVLGLVLIPVGALRETRRRRRGRTPWQWPTVDFGRSPTRRMLAVLGVLTVVNLGIVSLGALGAVKYMATDQFCGQVCHEPMRPEFTAHQVAPHASVPCVSCHVSPGAAGAVRAKLNGARQAYLYLTGSHARPIGSPAANIPPSADTCARCHSVGHDRPDITRVFRTFADDQANTETATTLRVRTQAIHWHARPDVRIEYVATDGTRETIPYVRVTAPDGQVTEYFADGVTAAPAGAVRLMDCQDCHNRPAHAMTRRADQAVDEALAAGRISLTLPFARREAVAALTAPYATEADAAAAIRARLSAFYATRPDAPPTDVARAIDEVIHLYRVSVFPDMRVGWGTYVTRLGHADGSGCFRCHDDGHKTRSERVIRQDCELCHREQ